MAEAGTRGVIVITIIIVIHDARESLAYKIIYTQCYGAVVTAAREVPT